ncbi:hypothetical protein HJD18_14370 [Thermoleophilia bacterium SCSIO 60948]|nr:hypothetical protein HJD18_14370 [Thermoleophilia bacterium SCSIO 60948]
MERSQVDDAAARVRRIGEPLLSGLAEHSPAARERADSIASYAFAAAAATGSTRAEAELVREIARLSEVGAIYEPADAQATEPARPTEAERARIAARYDASFKLCRGAGVEIEHCEAIRRAGERADGGPTPVPRESRIIALARTTRALLTGSEADPVAGLRAIAAEGELDAEIAEALAPLLVPRS